MAFTPFGTIADLRAYSDLTITVFNVVDGGRSGQFYFDSADSTSTDDGNMVVIQGSSRRFKRLYEGYVAFEWFGVTPTTTFANETVPMQAAVDYLISRGGGLIKLRSKIYTGSIVWNGNNNISIEGLSPQVSAIYPAVQNTFAIRVESGYPALGAYFSNFRLYGGDDAKRHGIYLNCGSTYYFDNMRFDNCGIGLLSNGTIDNRFNACVWQGNYLATLIGTFKSGYTTISNINGQTVTVSEAFTDTQPCEQNFVSCRWVVNTFGVIVDYPSGTFAKNANCKFWGGQSEGNKVFFYSVQEVEYFEYPTAIENMWFENPTSLSNTYPYKSYNVPQCDIYSIGGRIIMKNTGIGCVYILNAAALELDNCCIFRGSEYIITEDIAYTRKGSISGRGMLADGAFFPHYFESAVNAYNLQRAVGCYTIAKNRLTTEFKVNKVYSQDHGVNSTVGGALGTMTITKVQGGVMDGVCWNVLTTATNAGLQSGPFTPKAGKFYLTTMALRSTGSPFVVNIGPVGGTGSIMGINITIPSEWQTMMCVGRPVGFASDRLLIYKTDGQIREFQISGWQILEFDTVEELFAFQKSDAFVVDQVIDLSVTSNSATSAPNKASLNSSYGLQPNGFVVTYPSISGGASDYQKLSDSTTSDWIETIWSTGVKSIVI